MSDAPDLAHPHRLTQKSWRRYTEWPLVVVAVVFLVAYSIEVIGDVRGSRAAGYDAILWGTWVVFAIDYLVSLVLAERRARWFVFNLHELAILVLPMLRPLRLLRLLFILRVTHRAAERALRGRILVYAFGGAFLLTYVAALAVLDAEQNVPGARIHRFGDAWWWAVVTITGVGYGDYYPVTFVGRMVAVGLMIGGVALIGLTAASMASWLIDQVGSRVSTQVADVQRDDVDIRRQLQDVTAQLTRVTALLEARDAVSPAAGPASLPAPGEHDVEQRHR
jgi:voltage-gated potassium channel